MALRVLCAVHLLKLATPRRTPTPRVLLHVPPSSLYIEAGLIQALILKSGIRAVLFERSSQDLVLGTAPIKKYSPKYRPCGGLQTQHVQFHAEFAGRYLGLYF